MHRLPRRDRRQSQRRPKGGVVLWVCLDHARRRPKSDAAGCTGTIIGVEARGRYHARGWSIDLRGGSRSGSSRLATYHEAWHDRLQFTTIYGLTVQALWAVGAATGDEGFTARGDALMAGALRTHEEFAAWSTEMVAGADLNGLRTAYPIYRRHAQRARARIGDLPTPSTRLHAASALYRSIMQPAPLVALAPHLSNLHPNDIDRMARPDHRLSVITRALTADPWPDVASSALTVTDFVEESDEEWAAVAQAFYDHAATLLRGHGCPTLDHDGQLNHVQTLYDAAVQAAGGPIHLAPPAGSAYTVVDSDVVLRALESEEVTFSDEPAQVWLPPDADIADLICGTSTTLRHLFLVVRDQRPREHSIATGQGRGRRPHLYRAILRGPRRGTHERAVLQLDVTDRMSDVLNAPVPVISNISMRSLAEDHVADLVRPLDHRWSTVLVDLSPTTHLRMWLSDTSLRGTWSAVQYAADQTQTTLLAWQLWAGDSGVAAGAPHPPDDRSRLYLALVGLSYPTALQVWLDDHPDLTTRFRRDDGLADRYDSLISITVGHLLAEETTFSFRAGDLP